MMKEEEDDKKKQEEEDDELAAWFAAEMIKEEEASKNKNQEVDDAQFIKEKEGRKKLARTHYSDAVAKVDEEVKSSDTRTSVRDRVKNL
ncbi:unnamed protein product [Brassica oleracea]